jgi:S-adenosylmethionine:diacylglycerol 3-amino-3-carboxypropyl transferase
VKWVSYLYNFGLSQEDERSETLALDLRPADRVLSIVSAGEMPLSLLSMGVAQVLAVDINPAQLHLARLKLAAACTLERSDAIRFLGYRTASLGGELALADRFPFYGIRPAIFA